MLTLLIVSIAAEIAVFLILLPQHDHGDRGRDSGWGGWDCRNRRLARCRWPVREREFCNERA
jgi:hypothetical protein